jgi:amidase
VAETRDLKGFRIGYAPDIAGVGINPTIENLCRTAASRLTDAAAVVKELAFSLADGHAAYLILRGETMVSRFSDRLHETDKFGPNVRGNIEAGLKLTVRDIAAAERKRAELWNRCRVLFERIDLLLTPTTPVQPFPVEQNYPESIAGRKLATYIDWIASTFLVTLCGLPAASVLCGCTSTGLPIGLQIIGPRFAEPQILRVAKLVEEMNPIGWPPIVQTPVGA